MIRHACLLLVAAWCAWPSVAVAAEHDANAPPQRHAYKLGEFAIKDYRPVERQKVKLLLTVWVEVPEEDYRQFEQLWPSREHRVRSQVITAARLVPGEEYDDPTLHALRRRIYFRLRRALPELPVAEVFVSDFSYLRE